MPPHTLTLRRLNRAALARQMLLERDASRSPLAAIAQAGGLRRKSLTGPISACRRACRTSGETRSPN